MRQTAESASKKLDQQFASYYLRKEAVMRWKLPHQFQLLCPLCIPSGTFYPLVVGIEPNTSALFDMKVLYFAAEPTEMD